MTSAIPPSSPGAPPPSRLNGWKEIAAHFGRGIRTVQRWEKAFGMPVYRIGTGRGENVHAFSEELDAWLTTAARSRDLGDHPGEGESAEAAPPEAAKPADEALPPADDSSAAPAAPAVRGYRAAWIALAALVVLAATSAIFWMSGRPEPPPATRRPVPLFEPVSAKVDGNRLVVYDLDGRALWDHAFDAPLDPGTTSEFPGRGTRILFQDINADGLREVLLFAPDHDRHWATRLFCFNASGDQLWSQAPANTIRFGDHEYPPPWAGHRLFVTGTGSHTAVWAAWIHLASGAFPCLLQQLSGADGRPRSEYWSAGYVNLVQAETVLGRPSILVGANNNDHRAASLAVFDADAVRGSAPADTPDKTCRNCGEGGPRAFLVFPALDIPLATELLPFVYDVRRADSGALTIWVLQPAFPEGYGSTIYQLDEELRPISAEIADSYKAIHKAHEERGTLRHQFGAVDLAQLWPLLVLRDGKFVPVSGVSR